MTAGKRLLAIDLGASGGKCFVGTFSADGFQMEEIHRFDHGGVSFFLADRGGAVTERTHWNDTAIYAEIIRGLHAYRRQFGPHLDALGIDTWGADAQWISADGESLGRLYGYRDHRLDGIVEELCRLIPPEKVYAITGIHFLPFNLSNQLLWFIRNRPELLKAAVKVLPVPTLLNYYLGGCTEVDSTWASITQLMDARRARWSPTMLRALKIPARVLPGIVAPGTAIGALRPPLAESVGLAPARIVAVGSHDTASAFAAAPVQDTRDALIISSGTWSLIGRLVARPVTSPAARAANLSNEGGIGNTRLLKNCMGTWIVQELLRVWETADGQRMPWAEVDRLQAAAPPFGGFIDPDDRGFFNPANMEQAILAYLSRTGQPAPSGRGALLRLVYESLALKYREINATLNTVTGLPARVVHIVGGGCGNVLLNQFTADALGLPVQAGPREATAVGNLMVQAVGLGLLPNLPAALPLIRQTFPITVYNPQSPGVWDAAYQRFRAVRD
ncbi:MAG: rhamnulokinase [Lentisphaerae bacterium]|nr:rhamnulokinase [Lentisphaerota bacterium]